MKPQISIGSSRSFALHNALLVYRSESNHETFVTLHQVQPGQSGRANLPPALGPAEVLTSQFLVELVRGLGADTGVELLPENALARTPSVIAWWIPAQKRRIFFEHSEGLLSEISGMYFSQPALVMRVDSQGLSVRALAQSVRPKASTAMKVAPYWNTYSDGGVCLGSMRVPKTVAVSAIGQWESSFYESSFTHPSDHMRITRHPGGSAGLWRELAGSKSSFPSKYLCDAKQTLAQFLKGHS